MLCALPWQLNQSGGHSLAGQHQLCQAVSHQGLTAGLGEDNGKFWKNVWVLESSALSLGRMGQEKRQVTLISPTFHCPSIPSEWGQSSKGHLVQVGAPKGCTDTDAATVPQLNTSLPENG